MSKALTVSRLKKLLAAAPKEQLVDDIVELFTKFEVVQKHFALRFQPQDAGRVLEDYKMRVRKAMLPKSEYGEPKVQEARRLVEEYRAIALSPISAADLMLVYVECGVSFLVDLGDYKESFYDSLQRMFEAMLKLVKENALELEFADRCRKMIKQCTQLGYGFGDEMGALFNDCFA